MEPIIVKEGEPITKEHEIYHFCSKLKKMVTRKRRCFCLKGENHVERFRDAYLSLIQKA